LGNYQVALEYHNKALEINPNNAHPYYSRGRAYLALKNYDLAEKDFNKAVELKWRLPNSYSNLLLVYKNSRNCEKAEIVIEKLYELKAFSKEDEQELIECYLLNNFLLHKLFLLFLLFSEGSSKDYLGSHYTF
jgi:Flp pilus assembly protein TadD